MSLCRILITLDYSIITLVKYECSAWGLVNMSHRSLGMGYCYSKLTFVPDLYVPEYRGWGQKFQEVCFACALQSTVFRVNSGS